MMIINHQLISYHNNKPINLINLIPNLLSSNLVITSQSKLILSHIEILRDLLQLISLIILPQLQDLLFNHHQDLKYYYSKTLLVWIPASLGLDLTPIFYSHNHSSTYNLNIFYFLTLTLILLYEYYNLTGAWNGLSSQSSLLQPSQGLEPTQSPTRGTFNKPTVYFNQLRSSNFYSNTITLTLTSIYLPVIRLNLETLLWANNPPIIQSSYRTITNTHRELVGLVLFLSILSLLLLGCWFPIRFYKTLRDSLTIRQSNPSLSKRLPYFNHHYKHANRWAITRDFINRFGIKLIVILLITIPIKDNSIFINRSNITRHSIDLFRLLSLSFTFLSFWFYQSKWKPYPLKSLNLIQRMNIKFCLFLSILCLGSVLIHSQQSLFDSILLIWTTLMYLLNIHFLILHSKRVQRLISTFNQIVRIDQNLFSADFDFQKEVIRRVWDEGLCVLILGMPEYRMPEGKQLEWREEVPGAPYLVNFDGTHAERLLENIRLFQALGPQKYRQASQAARPKDHSDHKQLSVQKIIQSEFTGPDCFWKPLDLTDLQGVTTFFGRADVIPFPFTVIFKYDQQLTPVSITRPAELRAFVAQNQHAQVQMRRKVRLILRALENKQVFAPVSVPWETVQATSKAQRSPLSWFRGTRPDVQFRSGVLKIHRNCPNQWQGYNFNSGFRVSIEYKDGQSIKSNGSTISQIHHIRMATSLGLRDDFKLTPTLAKLFHDNHSIINITIGKVQRALGSHRSYFASQATCKQNKLSFSFLELFAQDQTITSTDSLRSRLESYLLLNEVDQQLRRLPEICQDSLQVMEGRMELINQSKLNQWWFVVFDDIYRRNYDMLQRLSEDFSPYSQGSICYKPMIRSDLEQFLTEKKLTVFHAGFLNQLYFHLDLFMSKQFDDNPAKDPKANFQDNNGLPGSKSDQGVCDNDKSDDRDQGNLLTRVKQGLKRWLMLDEPSLIGTAEDQESNDVDDGKGDLEKSDDNVRRDRQRTKQLINLDPMRNFITLKACNLSLNSEKPLPSTPYDQRETTYKTVFNGASSTNDDDDLDRSTCLDSSSRDPSNYRAFIDSHSSNTLDISDGLNGFDVTDHIVLHSDTISQETDSTIYGFH